MRTSLFRKGRMKKYIIFFLLLSLVSINTEAFTTNIDLLLCTDQDSDFDGYRYPEQIPHCKRNVSASKKREIYRRNGISRENQVKFYIDHLVSLSHGGNNSFENLVPIRRDLSTSKIEMQIYQWLKNGLIPQSKAVRLILDFKRELLENLP